MRPGTSFRFHWPLLLVFLLLVFLLHASALAASVSLLREYRVPGPGDPKLLFGMTLTASHDVVSLRADPSGNWHLSRVRGWLERSPRTETIVVPGLARGSSRDWFSGWQSRVLVTPDDRFAICEASAFRSGAAGEEEIVSVVDLVPFRVIASVRGSEIAELRGSYRSFHAAGGDYLIGEGHTSLPRNPGDDVSKGGSVVRLAVLSLPELRVMESCEYSEWTVQGRVERREGDGGCARLLAYEPGTGSVGALEASWQESRLREEGAAAKHRRPAACGVLSYSTQLSPDGRFEGETCGHEIRGFRGPVVLGVVENIYVVKTGEKAGTVQAGAGRKSRFAVVNGQEYLLVMEGGSRLLVYRITE